ncbi:Zn-ribbon domain-containing OB-fold protein [Nocardia sp. SC052]|uniref:Zn-ribbon domain-containing OB-fold protein n=1 Tax=Nocardia sichangensis TaxID=3385975 RepID=UPI0039A036E0
MVVCMDNPLFSLAEASARGRLAKLDGGVCVCGFRFFPMQRIGCERCGRYGDHLKTEAAEAHGTLIAAVTVRLVTDPDLPVPFTAGYVRLDSGVKITAIIDGETPAPGSPVAVAAHDAIEI